MIKALYIGKPRVGKSKKKMYEVTISNWRKTYNGGGEYVMHFLQFTGKSCNGWEFLLDTNEGSKKLNYHPVKFLSAENGLRCVSLLALL